MPAYNVTSRAGAVQSEAGETIVLCVGGIVCELCVGYLHVSVLLMMMNMCILK